MILSKLLSHRIRGFGGVDNAGTALRAACASDVPWLELDTRVSQDGTVFVHHDPSIAVPGASALLFASTAGADLSAIRYPDGEPLLSLSAALESFATLSRPPQKLCIDIKDFGFEAIHLKLVRDAGLEDRVVFISWIPQTILRLHELGTTAPLILSYVSVADASVAATVVARWLAGHRLRVGRFIALGAETIQTPLGPLSQGFNHALWCRQLPPSLLAALLANRGGVCVQRRVLGPRLSQYCRDTGLQLWTYSVRTLSEFTRYATQPDIDVVFCDDAPRVWREIKNQQGL